MPLLYWALEDIQQSTIADGFIIVTKTDVACHQWLRHTLVPPQRHAKPVLRRGLLMQWDARFCFVAFEDLEQDEAGDTFTHTFTWHGWLVCQTRYFYFWATSEGEKMKSTSPIFSKHFVPPKIFTALCHEQDFDTWSGWQNSCPLAHNHPGVSCRDIWPSVATTQQHGVGTKFYISRAALVFDTTSLNPAWRLAKATLTFMTNHIYSLWSGDLCFVDANGITLPCVPTSFSELQPKTNILARVPAVDLIVNDWHSVDLDPLKLSSIKPGQLTIIGFRGKNELDFNCTGPGSGGVWGYGIWSCQQAGNQPYLTIYGE